MGQGVQAARCGVARLPPGGSRGKGGLYLMVCSSCRDSWLRGTPLVSAMNTAFPEASCAWRNGIWGARQG